MKDQSTFWDDLKSGKFVSMVKECSRGQSVNSSKEMYNIMKPLFAETDDIEMFYGVFLDSHNRILAIEKLFQGSIMSASIYPREVIKRVLTLKATAMVAVHNHPAGDTKPSSEDKTVTVRLWISLRSIEVSLHDHIIIGEGYHSMADEGFMDSIKNSFSSFMNNNF